MANEIKGTTENDILLGTSGDDVFYASGGTDKVWGGTGGNDSLILTGKISDYSVLDNGNGSYTIKDLRDGAPDGELVVRAIDSFVTANGSYTIDQLLENTSNVITGTDDNETLLGTDRDDVFYAGGGNDRIWGGTGGTDTLVLDGNLSDYAIKDNGNGSYTIKDLRDDAADEEMVVRSIEVFEFANQTTDIEEFLANNFNEVTGTDGDDHLNGSVSDDRFEGGSGNDVIWGNEGGEDVAVYSGKMEDYKVYSYGDGRFIIKDTREGAQNDGEDVIRNIEMLQFDDQTVTFDAFLESFPLIPIYGTEGTENDDVLIGSDGDDVMQALGGNDRIWGGHEGKDVVIFRGNLEDYIITDNDNGAYTVQDMREGSPDGTNVVRDFEYFQFADQAVTPSEALNINNERGSEVEGTAAADIFNGAHTNGLFDAHTNDLLRGGMGDDEIRGGPGDDIIIGDTEDAVVQASLESIVYKDVDSELPTFDFGAGLYQVINGQIKLLDPATGVYEDIGPDHSNFNAIGMNTTDGYAYGIGSRRTEHQGDLLRIGSDGNIETVATGFKSVAAGTFGGDGRLYIRVDKDTLQAINVETLETENFDFTGGNARSVYDLVFIDDGAEGKFYGLNKYGQLTVFDMNTQEMTITDIEGIDVTGAFGAGWTADGALYFSHNQSGNIYGISGIDSDNPTAGLLSKGERSSINDGFSFNEASLPDEFMVSGGDFLMGGAGNDTLIGGGGDDRLNGGEGADNLQGGDGLDSADYTHATEGVTVNLATGGSAGQAAGDTYDSVERVDGSEFADNITGDDGANMLVGNGGDDVLNGGLGNDNLRGGGGADRLDGGDGFDTVTYFYSEEGVTVNLATNVNSDGDAEGDLLYNVEQVQGSNIGNDDLTGSGADDKLHGFGGDDVLKGGSGNDDLRGGTGNDALYGDNGADLLVGQEGNDMLYGGNGNDNVQGGQGNDSLYGDNGVDRLWGADGDDRLEGGAGDDFLRGGDGVDTFVFAENSGNDTILDFANGTDKIDFSQLEGVESMDDLSVNTVSETQSVISYNDGIYDVELTVDSYNALDLDQNDFVF